MVEPTTRSPSPPTDQLSKLRCVDEPIEEVDEGNEIDDRHEDSSSPGQGSEEALPPTAPIKVDINPDDPDEIPYEVIPNRIFIGGFPLNTTEAEVRKTFGQFGEILDVKMIKKEVAGQTKGFGFVTYVSNDIAAEVRVMENVKINGKKLNLGPAMRRLYPTLREMKEARRAQLASDGGTESPSTTAGGGGTPPASGGQHRRGSGGQHYNGHYSNGYYQNQYNNGGYGNKKYYRKNRQYQQYNGGDGAPNKTPVPLMSIDMTPMYIAPFDLNKAINTNSEHQFMQCTIPMNQHTLPAAIRQMVSTNSYSAASTPPPPMSGPMSRQQY